MSLGGWLECLLSHLYKCFESSIPKTLAPKGETVVFAETLENFQHSSYLMPESRSHTLKLVRKFTHGVTILARSLALFNYLETYRAHEKSLLIIKCVFQFFSTTCIQNTAHPRLYLVSYARVCFRDKNRNSYGLHVTCPLL
jgi:hypothetical protein